MANGLVLLYGDRALATRGASVLAAPTLDADYPAVNVLQVDRGVIMRTLVSPAGTITVDVDLGAGYTGTPVMSGCAFWNFRTDSPVGIDPILTVYTASSYPTFGAAVATLMGNEGSTGANGARDIVFPFGAGYTNRYWRFVVTTNGYRVSLGKFAVGQAVTLPYFYSPASKVGVVEPSDEFRTIGKVPINVIAGEVRREYALNFSEVLDADKAIWEQIQDDRLPFGMVDADGKHRHARIGGSRRIDFQHDFGVNPSIWSFDVPVEALP